MPKMIPLFLVLIFFISCQRKSDSQNAVEVDEVVRAVACSTSALETQMNSIFGSAVTDADFSFQVERADGRLYRYNRGNVSGDSLFESASTSKLVSAIMILRLVDQGILSLTDSPQKFITSWPIPANDPLLKINLAQLLSFTSGLESEPLCLNAGFSDFETCVKNIASTNSGNNFEPGTVFYYSSTHLQVAGLMAVKAKNVASWQNIFSSFKSETGLFSHSAYDLPSVSNPRLAGGMHWTGNDYMAFLRSLKNGALLSSAMQSQLLADQIANSSIGNSPAKNNLKEDWHYSFGLWHECQNATYNCTPGVRVSSPGAYGAYPFWDRQKNYFGILARQGALETFKNGAALERLIRVPLDEWATCSLN